MAEYNVKEKDLNEALKEAVEANCAFAAREALMNKQIDRLQSVLQEMSLLSGTVPKKTTQLVREIVLLNGCPYHMVVSNVSVVTTVRRIIPDAPLKPYNKLLVGVCNSGTRARGIQEVTLVVCGVRLAKVKVVIADLNEELDGVLGAEVLCALNGITFDFSIGRLVLNQKERQKSVKGIRWPSAISNAWELTPGEPCPEKMWAVSIYSVQDLPEEEQPADNVPHQRARRSAGRSKK